MDLTEIDKTYEYYEKRYNLTKMAGDCGISLKYFEGLNSKNKFLVLSKALKDASKINLASFFYGKLFEVSSSIEALLNKVDCLIKLGEYDEAVKFNNIGWELYLEDHEVDSREAGKILSYQKALISFYTEKFHTAETICEDSIIKYKSEEFYYLLCADFIALNNMNGAKKLFSKYSNKFGNPAGFLFEIIVLLLEINFIDKVFDFLTSMFNIKEKQNKIILNHINKYYLFNKNKSILKKYIEKELYSIIKISHPSLVK
jgi:tetratricopeptide (TPR) repeat protein